MDTAAMLIVQSFQKLGWVCQIRMTFFSFFQPSSIHGWTLAFLLGVHRLWAVTEGRLSHFLPHWLRTGWQSVISPGKSLEILLSYPDLYFV